MSKVTRAPWTLRRRLTVTMAALLVVAAALIGVVSVLSLRSFLVDRLDTQLNSAVIRTTEAVTDGIPVRPGHNDGDNDHDDRPNNALLAPGQAAGTLVAIVAANGSTTAGILNDRGEVRLVDVGDISNFTTVKISREPSTIHVKGSQDYRAIAVNTTGDAKLVIALPMTEVNAASAQLITVILLVTAFGVGAVIIAGRLLIRYELRPLDRVADSATRVAELPLDKGDVDLAERVSEDDTDPRTEVGRVGSAFNHMLGHISHAFAARQASEEKVRRFVADASHELRTPLASIRGYAELTRRSGAELPEDVRHSLNRIESEATRMTGLVEDLLLLARLDEGRELQNSPVDLSRIIVDAVSDAHAAGPDHTWDMELPEEPLEVIGDQARLHQVVVNLLANARVHTPAGSTVQVVLEKHDENVLLKVIDNGPGIPQEQMPELFERFTRGDASRTRATGSTGLGLAIVNAVVQAHHGTVTVTSEPGKTMFTVSLPAAQ
ncbi:sensor histidine kinase [Aurantimicrobium photophilum]|uniref:histidine kinase n=1 Tax=Aurantimicrobium photophilum TaxID=1987356 RepID=A0A2Z3RZL0_9MICO|nr:HAMP domain-containing sensor histidine kinase [Aurantimicrobium photophilum]AWR22137.1 putative sensor histidine kinase TcrY [Aurantimicrobium photophilum]